MLTRLINFLAQPPANLCFELCDLRNYILLDHPTLKYIKPQMLDTQTAPPSTPSYGFYTDHGKPAMVIMVDYVTLYLVSYA